VAYSDIALPNDIARIINGQPRANGKGFLVQGECGIAIGVAPSISAFLVANDKIVLEVGVSRSMTAKSARIPDGSGASCSGR
jgi:hypothetical protein